MPVPGSEFVYNARGVIDTGYDFHGDDLTLSFCYAFGQDWHLLSGLDEGVSQTARLSSGPDCRYVWNFPLDVTFSSTNPYGWPQLVLYVYGKDFFGTDIVRGYSAVHLPITPGQHKLRLHCFVPSSASLLQRIISWLTGNTPEYLDPKMVAQARGREVTRVESQGFINVTLNVTIKDLGKLGYDCGVVSLGSLTTSSLLAAILGANGINSDIASGSRRTVEDGESSTPDGRSAYRKDDYLNSKGKRSSKGSVGSERKYENKGYFDIKDKASERRGLFSKYPSGSSDSQARGLVLVGGDKREASVDEPSTSGTRRIIGSATAAMVHAEKSKTVSNFHDSEDDDLQSDDTDDSRAKLHTESISEIQGRDNLAHDWDDSDEESPKKIHHEKNGKNRNRSQFSPNDRDTRNNNRRSSQTGVAFSKDSGIQFVSSPEGKGGRGDKGKGVSPNKVEKLNNRNRDSENNGRRRKSQPDRIGKEDGLEMRPSRKFSERSSPTGEKKISGSNEIAGLFSANRNTPQPLARKSVLQPISKKPLPDLTRNT